ncbi:MAG: hypothetical protein KBS91_04150 [Firmicutes bacterium]|nr:hypothetical protein [Candidatus Caballimonas caccae]
MKIEVNGKEFTMTKHQAEEIMLAFIIRYNILAKRNEYKDETPSMKLLSEIIEEIEEEYVPKGAKK